MVKSSNDYPTIIELQRVELEMRMLLRQYAREHEAFTADLQSGTLKGPAGQKRLNRLNQLTTEIEALSVEADLLLLDIEAKGIKNQADVRRGRPALKKLVDKINKDQAELAKAELETHEAEAVSAQTELSTGSDRWEYIVAMIVAIVVAILGARAMTTDTTGNVEIAILLMAAVALVSFVYKKLME
jgi:hypothetical protein